jgi:DnaJ like chaperone protein
MSIWGTLLGAVAGLALGGPIGALIGAALGQFAVDQPQQRRRAQDPATRQALFSVAVIALAAKMAASDGNSDPREKAAFDRLFKVTADEQENVSRFWRLAAQTSAGYESYAKQIGKLFKTEPAILEDVAGALCAMLKLILSCTFWIFLRCRRRRVPVLKHELPAKRRAIPGPYLAFLQTRA